MLLSLFNTNGVNAFVDELVSEIVRRAPPDLIAADSKGGRKADAKLNKWRDEALKQVAAFARRDKPNFFLKAHLANRLKWGLREAGYPADFVDEFAIEVASVAASANSPRSP